MTCKFFETLDKRWDTGARVCIGLDSRLDKLPPHMRESKKTSSPQLEFNVEIINKTKDLALCYKLNIAYYTAPGDLETLRNTVAHIRNAAEGVPIILDSKRGDIAESSVGYAAEAFEYLKCDAVTVNPFMGEDALSPFLAENEKGIFVLCRTSNPSASTFQDLIVEHGNQWLPLYQVIAMQVAEYWNPMNNCGLVVGATTLEQLTIVREVAGDMWLLIPGIGRQGGKIDPVMRAAVNSKGRGFILTSSRSIIFASSGKDFGDAARSEVLKLTVEINAALALL